jgi:hypothetical protein
MSLEPKAGFDWAKVTWGRPDSPVSVLCSYCSASLGEEELPLMAFRQRGFAARFCEKCQETWFGLQSFDEDGEP